MHDNISFYMFVINLLWLQSLIFTSFFKFVKFMELSTVVQCDVPFKIDVIVFLLFFR